MTLETFLEQFSGVIKFLLTAGAVYLALGLVVAVVAFGIFLYVFFVAIPRDERRLRKRHDEQVKRINDKWGR